MTAAGVGARKERERIDSVARSGDEREVPEKELFQAAFERTQGLCSWRKTRVIPGDGRSTDKNREV